MSTVPERTLISGSCHVGSSSRIRTDHKKREAVQNWPVPGNMTELRAFKGLCSYYQRFIKGFADIAKLFHHLTEKNNYSIGPKNVK